MKPLQDSRFSFLLILMVLLSFTAVSAKFYAGTVTEQQVSKTAISGKWIGISGKVTREKNTTNTIRIGSLNLNDNQTGKVLESSITGITGGGYFLAFAPVGEDLDTSTIDNLTVSDLEKNGIFSNETYPTFYPNYTEKLDNPSETFEMGKELRMNGQQYNASFLNLSGDADMYLLKYSADNGTEYPLFISPIDGLSRGSNYSECYISGCNFQTLLPEKDSSEFSYSVNLLSRGEVIQGCDTGLSENDTSIVLTGDVQQDDCLNFDSPGVYVDFYNSNIQGTGECAVNVRASGVTLKGPTLSGYTSAICIRPEAEGAKIEEGELRDNTKGIRANDVNFSAEDVLLEDNDIAVELQSGAKLEADNVSINKTRFYGTARTVLLRAFGDTLPNPVDASELVPLGRRLRIESTSPGSNNSWVKELGLGYPNESQTGLYPQEIYKYDGNGSGYNTERILPTRIADNEDYIYHHNGKISNFSIFAVYGNTTGVNNNDTEVIDGGDSDGSSGGGGGGGGAGGGGAPLPQPEIPRPTALNITAAQDFYNVKRGDTVSVNYAINNTGGVTVGNVTARMDSDWTSVPNTFDSLQPGERRQGTILMTIPEDAEVGNHTIDMEAVYRGSNLDQDEVIFNVSKLLEDSRLEVVESAPFVNLDSSSRRFVAVQVENPTNRPLNDLRVQFRSENDCATVRDRNYSVPANSVRNIRVELETKENSAVCNDALVFRSGSDIIAFAPMRIEVREAPGGLISLPVYLVVFVVWTILLGLRLRNKLKEDRGFV